MSGPYFLQIPSIEKWSNASVLYRPMGFMPCQELVFSFSFAYTQRVMASDKFNSTTRTSAPSSISELQKVNSITMKMRRRTIRIAYRCCIRMSSFRLVAYASSSSILSDHCRQFLTLTVNKLVVDFRLLMRFQVKKIH